MNLQAPSASIQRSFKHRSSSVSRHRLASGVRSCKFLRCLMLGVWCFVMSNGRAQEFLDKVDDALFLQTRDGRARVDLSGTFDLEGYYVDQRPPGLLLGDGKDFINPRLSLFLDARLGDHLYSFVQFRADRGFDPRGAVRDWRFDEYLLRWTPFDDSRLNFQIGKFATCVGNWVARHDSWNNPFITAPMPYENVTTVADVNVPGSPAAFLARRDIADNKPAWLPVLWGPAYTSGASVFGSIGRFDYALEFKNATVSSRPAVWDAQDLDWADPTVSARLGFRPDAAWNMGASFSRGTYLLPDAGNVAAFPASRSIGDFPQTIFGADAAYVHGPWQLWGEIFLSRFVVPNVGDADVLAYYIEAKYKFSARFFGALRWNQQFFGDVNDGTGGRTPWDRDVWRVDAALGCRLTRHLQGKLQYSFNHHRSALQQGEQLVATQVTMKF